MPDAETDAAPQARRLDLLGHAGHMREAAPLVVGESLER